MKKEELLKKIKVNNYLEWQTSFYSYSIFVISRGDLFRISDSINAKQIDDLEGIYIEDNPSHLLFKRNDIGECIEVKEAITLIKSGDDIIYESELYKGVEERDENQSNKVPYDSSIYGNEAYKWDEEETKAQSFSDQITNNENKEWLDYLENDNQDKNDSNFIYRISSEYLEMAKVSKPSDADFKVKKDETSLEINISFKFK